MTINEIAQVAGVSFKTVSRVLNGEAYVRDELREKVKAAAKKLNYQPNLLARSLKSNRSFAIAHFHDNPSPDYLDKVYNGMHKICRASGYFPVVERLTVPYQISASEYVENFNIDGAVLTPPICDDPAVLKMLNEKKIPFVRISPGNIEGTSSCTYIDDLAAAKSMTDHLINLGHDRIVFLAGPKDHLAASRRLLGFRQAIEEAQLSSVDCPVYQGDFSIRSGIAAAEIALESSQEITAIVAANDDMAVGVVMAALKRGMDIPGQLSITGFDGSRLSGTILPQLTTVRQPLEEMGKYAITTILQEIGQTGLKKQKREFNVAYLIRHSTDIPR